MRRLLILMSVLVGVLATTHTQATPSEASHTGCPFIRCKVDSDCYNYNPPASYEMVCWNGCCIY